MEKAYELPPMEVQGTATHPDPNPYPLAARNMKIDFPAEFCTEQPNRAERRKMKKEKRKKVTKCLK